MAWESLALLIVRAAGAFLSAAAGIAALFTEGALRARTTKASGIWKDSPFATREVTPWGYLLLSLIVIGSVVQFVGDRVSDIVSADEAKRNAADIRQGISNTVKFETSLATKNIADVTESTSNKLYEQQLRSIYQFRKIRWGIECEIDLNSEYIEKFREKIERKTEQYTVNFASGNPEYYEKGTWGYDIPGNHVYDETKFPVENSDEKYHKSEHYRHYMLFDMYTMIDGEKCERTPGSYCIWYSNDPIWIVKDTLSAEYGVYIFQNVPKDLVQSNNYPYNADYEADISAKDLAQGLDATENVPMYGVKLTPDINQKVLYEYLPETGNYRARGPSERLFASYYWASPGEFDSNSQPTRSPIVGVSDLADRWLIFHSDNIAGSECKLSELRMTLDNVQLTLMARDFTKLDSSWTHYYLFRFPSRDRLMAMLEVRR